MQLQLPLLHEHSQRAPCNRHCPSFAALYTLSAQLGNFCGILVDVYVIGTHRLAIAQMLRFEWILDSPAPPILIDHRP